MGRVLVTAGAKGMGAAIVRALVEAGHDVTFTVRSSGEAAEALATELKAAHPGRDVAVATLDLADKAAVDAFCAELEQGEALYGLVHNAGQPYDQLAAVMDQAKAEAVMQVNFFAFTRLVNAAVRPMMRARTGRIVAIGSVTAERSNQGNAAYGASKAALAAYCRTLAIESAKRGVAVNVVAPGFVDTDMMAKYADYRDKMESQIPAGRFARPEEIGALVAYLMSPLAGYLTGATIAMDGGLTASMGLQR
ncbi:MAG: SDR family oxidoreductase [Phreatobacter sp.]|uniref:SDR family oxidoreductase n=1 Tax=Phreatobacter sp. TaxID=1966341 RepID=UPI001A561518|nr:SDR family NAD(P)-dependent oxidoreductase [Phreatobacter sp.]MBL8571934.1 SDR family oxidoreductase [Phreatobacter sp.]